MPSYEDAKVLLRVLTPVVKELTAKAAIAGLSECMEALGGVGYLENEGVELNVARLLRDACVLSIWEGGAEVEGGDVEGKVGLWGGGGERRGEGRCGRVVGEVRVG
ncbi:hypothetical protein MMC30_002701 [Trapelia coarctata]|nr:hypothetical protein [Trapelia coarctata]